MSVTFAIGGMETSVVILFMVARSPHTSPGGRGWPRRRWPWLS